MTSDECSRQALKQAQVKPEQMYEAVKAASNWVAPYLHHDAAVDPGTVLVDEVDPDTLEHRTVEHQIHAPRSVKPFIFGPAEVRDLANHIRRELRLK